MISALPTLDLALLFPRAPAPTQFDGAHAFYLARAAVHHAIKHFLDGKPGTVLMPAYHHGVEVEAVRAAGARIAFYRVDPQMRIDVEDIAERAKHRDVRVVYVTHFIGFAQPVRELLALCRARGQILVEDCALALLSRDPEGNPLGSTGDAAIYCLYKTLPVPHGGLLRAPSLPPPSLQPIPDGAVLRQLAGHFVSRHRLGVALKRFTRGIADALVPAFPTGTQHLLPRELVLAAAPLVQNLIGRFDFDAIAARRRENYQRLVGALDGCVATVHPHLAPRACPLFLPVRVADKPRLQRLLLRRNIETIDFWSSGDPACPVEEFPEVAALRREVLELPCHQSLGDEEIDFVARAMKECAGHA